MSGKLEIGVMVGLSENVNESFEHVAQFGLHSCQLCCWKPSILTPALADKVVAASRKFGVKVSHYWAGHSGETVWNFLRGPATIGLVPPLPRAQRVMELKQGADFAAQIGTSYVITHAGFIPEDPNDANYPPLLAALGEVVSHCKSKKLTFCFETGQETPVTLLRTIEDLGKEGLGINLDPANLILYGKANPVDALEVFGQYVCGVHAKDGCYPTNGRELGAETPLGQGKVDFPRLVAGLKKLGYTGPLTIEREISGDQQIADIKAGIKLLEPLL